MRIPRSLQSEVSYSRKLFEAGIDAVHSGTQTPQFKTTLSHAARSAWPPALFGAAAGLLAARLAGKNSRGRNALIGALAGGALGFSGAVAWSSRKAGSAVLRKAQQNFDTVNNQHWLEKHPIAYG